MYIENNGEKYYLSRVYWFHSGNCTIWEFANAEGDVIDYEVNIDERITDKVKVMEGWK